MILITGATGHFGQAAIDALISQGTSPVTIAALVRPTQAESQKVESLRALGVQIRFGDYNDYRSLLEAFKGIEQLLFVSSSELANRGEQQVQVVKAAQEAGVQHIVYTSLSHQHDRSDSPMAFVLNSHLATEKAIKESAMRYSLLRNNLYMDLIPWFLGDNVVENGVFFPAGDGKIGFLLRSEMAEAAAAVLSTTSDDNSEYEISAIHPVSFTDIAHILTQIYGQPIMYHKPDYKTYIDAMTAVGVPTEYAAISGGFGEAARQGELETTHTDIVKLLGREPLSVKSYLSSIYANQTA